MAAEFFFKFKKFKKLAVGFMLDLFIEVELDDVFFD